MKKMKIAALAVGAVLMLTSCGAYQGKISMGNDSGKTSQQAVDSLKQEVRDQLGEEAAKIVEENKEELGKVAEQINGDSKETSVKDLSEYNGKTISGLELQKFIDKYKGNPDLAIVVCTDALVGVYATKGKSYAGTVGYDNLNMKVIMDDNGMVWSYGINYNAQYKSNIKTNKDGTAFFDMDGFEKDADGKVKMYTNFNDAGIDPSYTEYIAGDSKFDAAAIKNKDGKITGMYFSEQFKK
jgi:hypothetical protein